MADGPNVLAASGGLAAPVSDTERVASLDVLRGFAVLGILVMNIQSFAMVGAAYMNPTALGEPSTVEYWIWLVGHVLTDRKFMTIFSMLFGAGIVLMADRAEARGIRPAGLHYRRMGLLVVMGLLHAYLLWYGDILYHYGMCGLVVYLFRRKQARTLIIVGLAVTAVASALSILSGWSMQYWPEAEIKSILQLWTPGPEDIAREEGVYLSGWLGQMAHRAHTALFFQTFLFLMEFAWRAGGLMLVGMGLYKFGVISARRSSRFYATWIALAVLIGVPTILFGVYRNEAADWSVKYSFFHGGQYNYWASILVSLGWISLVMLACKHCVAAWVTRPLAAVGRMALTNYLLETVLCTMIFYGHGIGLFGKVQRPGQIGVVLAVWAVILIISPIWLRHFRFGPAEWLWRTVTYLKAQPMRRA